MTIDWIPGVLQLPATTDGGAQDLSYPPRLVLHTTEGGGTVESLALFYRSSTYWPHFTADLAGMHLAQHIPLSRGGRALSHTTSTETNDANCIQVEIIGHAAEAASWPAGEVDWLGRALKPVLDALAIPRLAPKFLPYPASAGASPVRFGEATWRAFSGVCGHQHVPENDHGDPGAMDINRFLIASTGNPVPTPPAPAPVPPPVTVDFPGDNVHQTDIDMRLDSSGNGHVPISTKAVNVHSVLVIGTPDPAVSHGYQQIPRVALTIGTDGNAEIVVEGGLPNGPASVRVVHE